MVEFLYSITLLHKRLNKVDYLIILYDWIIIYLQIATMNNSTDDFSEYNQVCFCVCLILSRWWWYIYPVIIIKQSPSRPLKKIIIRLTLSFWSTLSFFSSLLLSSQVLISVILISLSQMMIMSHCTTTYVILLSYHASSSKFHSILNILFTYLQSNIF